MTGKYNLPGRMFVPMECVTFRISKQSGLCSGYRVPASTASCRRTGSTDKKPAVRVYSEDRGRRQEGGGGRGVISD